MNCKGETGRQTEQRLLFQYLQPIRKIQKVFTKKQQISWNVTLFFSIFHITSGLVKTHEVQQSGKDNRLEQCDVDNNKNEMSGERMSQKKHHTPQTLHYISLL